MVTRLNTFLAEVCSQHGPEQMKNSEHNNKEKKNVQKYYYAAERDNIYMIPQVCQLHLLEPFIDYH